MIESPQPSVPSVRRGRPRLAALAGVVAVLLCGVAPAPALAAAPTVVASTPTPDPTPSAAPGEAVLTLAPITGGILRPGERLTVSVTMSNGTAAPALGGTVSLGFGAAPLASRAELGAWLGGETGGVAVTEVATIDFPTVAPGEVEPRGIMSAEGDPLFAALAPGVYPVVATLTTPVGSTESTSAVVVPDDSAREVGIGVVVPITGPGTAEGLLTAAQLEELTAPDGSLAAQLDAVDGTEAILAVDPAVTAAIRVLGSEAPETAAAWLERLEALPNTRFALQFGDADVASQVEAGILPPLRPRSLQAYMSPEAFIPQADAESPAPTPTPTPTPEPSADPSEPVYPDLTALLDIGTARAGVFWPASGTAGPEVVAQIGELSVDDQDGITLIPSTTTLEGGAGATVPARGQAVDAAVLVYDSAVSEQLARASTVDEGTIRGAHLAAATAYLSFAAAETGGAPLLVTVDRAENRSRVALRTAVTTALEAPSVVPYSLGALAAAPSESVEVGAIEPEAPRVAAASALVADEDALSQFSSVLDDPSLLTGPERAEVLQLMGEGWRAAPDAWGSAITTHREESATTLDSVGIIRASPIQLITSGAVIPVWVRNDLPYPVNVTLFASPDDLRLEVQETTRVIAQPETNTRVEVPVQAQIGSGDVTIAFELRSPTGVPIGDPQTREVYVRADWEGIGLLMLAVLAIGFVSVGVVRTVLRRRARRTEADGPTEADAEAHPDAEQTEEPRA